MIRRRFLKPWFFVVFLFSTGLFLPVSYGVVMPATLMVGTLDSVMNKAKSAWLRGTEVPAPPIMDPDSPRRVKTVAVRPDGTIVSRH